MRTSLLILMLLICSKAFGQGAYQKLPKPTQEQIKNEHVLDKGLHYLQSNFKPAGNKTILKTFTDCKENCTCSWEQSFEKGITYTFNDCHESGFDIVITFRNYTIREIIKFVDTLFKTDDNVWNKDKSEYKPKDEGVGCYYIIKQDKETVVLDYYCGC